MNSSRRLRRTLFRGATLAAAIFLALGTAEEANATALESYTLFESGQVRPLALSPNGKFLFAVNTPDNRLEIFAVKQFGAELEHRASVPVGLEPVAVAARSDTEVWVVNHLSDSISVIKIDPFGYGGAVVRTLLVGDEPRDIVFGGLNKRRAFITAAHRGQNAPFDPQLTTPGVNRADVWVFDALNLGASLGGDPINIVSLFSDTPRALAVTPDGSKVYAAAFHSGNRTTTLHDSLVPDGGEANGGVPGPNAVGTATAPEVGVIVKYNGQHWVDSLGRDWDAKVKFSLPDKDVFVINANANPPAQIAGTSGFYTGVGTVLFNMAVNPASSKVYVSNTEARNDLRFTGSGTATVKTLRGHIHESRITVLSASGVTPRHLNKHIDYNLAPAAVPAAVNDNSLAQPQGMVVSSDGKKLYVAAFSSSKIGIFNTTDLENNTFTPSAQSHISLTGGGPTGLVLDSANAYLYALTRFDNAIKIVKLATKTQIGQAPLYNPEPQAIVEGRRFLYDARLSSANGESSCASCHVAGHTDHLAWDLGDPTGTVALNPNPFTDLLNPNPLFYTWQPGVDPTLGTGINPNFHPLKGPLVTQSLRGLDNNGPMHWRGDKTGGVYGQTSAQVDTGAFNEDAAFKQFNPAFIDLLGRTSQLSADEMQKFTNFVLKISYPPNPVRNLDNSLTPTQAAGRDFFANTVSLLATTCNDCHRVDPEANSSEGSFKGFFGTDGRSALNLDPQIFKIPHQRNLYDKVGMFGSAMTRGSQGPDAFLGDQVRGFGFSHDGSIPDLFRFNSLFDVNGLNTTGIPISPNGVQIKKNLEAYQLAGETNHAPIVGQQVTLDATNASIVNARIDLLVQRANAGEAELVVKAEDATYFSTSGYWYAGGGWFIDDTAAASSLSDAQLRSLVSSTCSSLKLTYTAVPLGSGLRIGIDRDLDGAPDGDDSDPENPALQ